MYCPNCGTNLTAQTNLCPNCGAALQSASTSVSLINKAVASAADENKYSLILVSRGTCDAVRAGDLLEDVFGYTDEESGNLVKNAPVVVGENLTADEAATVAQFYTEYGMDVSVTDDEDRYIDLSDRASSSIFGSDGSLLKTAAAVIGAITVANRITSYRRYKKPSLLDRIFRLRYTPAPPEYRRNFRRKIDLNDIPPRKTIRKPAAPRPAAAPKGHSAGGRKNDAPGGMGGGKPSGSHGGHGGGQPSGGSHGGHGGGQPSGSSHGGHGGGQGGGPGGRH